MIVIIRVLHFSVFGKNAHLGEQRIRILGNVLVSIFSESHLAHASFCLLFQQVPVIAFPAMNYCAASYIIYNCIIIIIMKIFDNIMKQKLLI